MTFDNIAQRQNENGHKTRRGKSYAGAYAHSILTMNRIQDENFQFECPEKSTNIRLVSIGKSIYNSF